MTQLLVHSACASAVLPAPCVRAQRPLAENPTTWRSAVTATMFLTRSARTRCPSARLVSSQQQQQLSHPSRPPFLTVRPPRRILRQRRRTAGVPATPNVAQTRDCSNVESLVTAFVNMSPGVKVLTHGSTRHGAFAGTFCFFFFLPLARSLCAPAAGGGTTASPWPFLVARGGRPAACCLHFRCLLYSWSEVRTLKKEFFFLVLYLRRGRRRVAHAPGMGVPHRRAGGPVRAASAAGVPCPCLPPVRGRAPCIGISAESLAQPPLCATQPTAER